MYTDGPLPTDSLLESQGLPPYPHRRRRHLRCDVNGPESEWRWNADNRQRFDGTVKVWAVATELEGRWLLYCWSPCRLEGNVRIEIPGAGMFEVEAPGAGSYWIIESSGLNARKL